MLLERNPRAKVSKTKGGCDKQGFPMKQGVLTPGRVCLLLHRGVGAFLQYLGARHHLEGLQLHEERYVINNPTERVAYLACPKFISFIFSLGDLSLRQS
ncbi:hypothetical protein GOBAR_DD00050 [Gossypium barbadense]|nr:hypothetical protein GOBAR_DD00050 [Gossypium barbadense]